ncbi:MAG: ATP-binding protein [Pseudomonadota bacterium]
MTSLDKRLRLLFVDDQEVAFKTWGEPLTHFGFDVTYAQGVEQAEQIILDSVKDRRGFHAIVLDRMMPDPKLNGHLAPSAGDGLRRFGRKRSPASCIVMLTNESDVTSAIRASQGGAWSFLAKGTSVERIAEELQHGMMHLRVTALYDMLVAHQDESFANFAMLELERILALIPPPVERKRRSESERTRSGPYAKFHAAYGKVLDSGSVRTADLAARSECKNIRDPYRWIGLKPSMLRQLDEEEFLEYGGRHTDVLIDWPSCVLEESVATQVLIAVRKRHETDGITSPLGKLVGVICVQSDRKYGFGEHEIHELMRVAQAVGLSADVQDYRNQAVDRSEHRVESELVAECSHQMRSPLMTARLTVDSLLLQQGLNDETTEGLATVRRSIETCNWAIEKLRRGSRWPQSDPVLIKLQGLLPEVVASYSPQRQKMLSTKVAVDLPSISGYSQELFYALTCLVDNAFDSIDRRLKCEIENDSIGKVQISVSISSNDRDLEIAVIDDGAGFDDEVRIDEIFDRGVSSKAETGSSIHGLGLWEVKRIVHLHGGTVEASQAPKGGACISLLFPISGPMPERSSQ